MANANVLIDNDKVKVTEWSFEVGDSTGHHIPVSYTHLRAHET